MFDVQQILQQSCISYSRNYIYYVRKKGYNPMAAALRIPLLDSETMQNGYVRPIQKVMRFEDMTVLYCPKG